MKNIIKLAYISIILILSLSSFSQNNTMFWMQHLPQQMNQNPAKFPNCKLFIDLPILPNFSINAFHSGFTIHDAFKIHPSAADSFMIDLNGIEAALLNKNSINLETEISILNFGFNFHRDMFLSFGINYKIFENFQYPKALIELRRGNYREDGTPLSFDFGQHFMTHREIFIGVSKKIPGGFTVGGRIKFLSGYANVKTNKMKVDWYTETHQDSMYEWTFASDFDIRASMPAEWELNYDSLDQVSDVSISEYNINEHISDLIFPGNPGFALDLGVEYNLLDRFTFSASVVDLGFISWKTNPGILTQQASFRFSGLDIGNYIGSLDDAAADNSDLGERITNDIIDTLKNVFNPEIENVKYKTYLNTKIYLGANASVLDWLDFGFLYRGAISNKSIISSYTASVNTNFLKGWSYTMSYSYMDGLANNIGLGFAYKTGPYQMYFITDNIAIPFWALNESTVSDKWIRNTKRVNFAFGVNILICKNKFDIGLLE